GGAIRDNGDEIALGGVIEGTILVLGNGQHRKSDARRVSQREIALGGHRLGGHHFKLARTGLAVGQQRFLVGKCRSSPTAIDFGGHLNPLGPRWIASARVPDRASVAQGKRQKASPGTLPSSAVARTTTVRAQLNGTRERGKRQQGNPCSRVEGHDSVCCEVRRSIVACPRVHFLGL